MNDSLETLLADGIIEAVIGQLKTGKEAEVWLVQHAGEVVAAKLYKERHERNFRNNIGYREGREVRNSRTRRAIEKGSRFGQAAAEDAWKSAESDSLYKLHAQGVRVPTPVLFYEGILLMELVLDPQGHPAPRLVEAPPATPDEAHALYLDLRTQVVNMLCADLIHGDLSPYNILMSWQGPTIIDFPQTVAAARNNRAEFYFRRDLDNVRNFLAGIAPWLYDMAGDTGEIWNAYVRRELTPDFTPRGNFREAPRRQGSQGRGFKGPRDGRGFNPERAGDNGHHRGFHAEPVVEQAPVAQPAMTPEEAAEAELRELEALVLKQGGGERGKPAAAPPPRGGRNRFGGGRQSGPRPQNGAQASGSGPRGGNGRPGPNEQRAGGVPGGRPEQRGGGSNAQRGGNPGARPEQRGGAGFNSQRGGPPGAQLEQRGGGGFNERRNGNPSAQMEQRGGGFNERRGGPPGAQMEQRGGGFNERRGGPPGAQMEQRGGGFNERRNGNPGARREQHGANIANAGVTEQRGANNAGARLPAQQGGNSSAGPEQRGANNPGAGFGDRTADGRPARTEQRNGRPPRNDSRPGRNGHPPRSDSQPGGNGYSPAGDSRGENMPRVERRGGPVRSQPVVETRPTMGLTPTGPGPNNLRETRPPGPSNGSGGPRQQRQGPNRGGPRPPRGSGPQVSFVARPAPSSDTEPHETGS